MKKILIASFLTAALCLSGGAAFAKEDSKEKVGEKLYKQHCAVCHPNGGNIVNPKKTLHKKDLEASGIRKAEDIIKTMRNPGPGMLKFDAKTIPDKEAKEIAEYIMKTFK